MKILEHTSLLPYNTFGIDVPAQVLVEYASVDELRQVLTRYAGQPLLPIGQGSNLLFTRPYDGVVLLSRMCRAKALKETETEVYIQAESGLKLDDLIAQLVDMQLTGLENLSYIPGTVGASAVQNVGAYGVEAKDVIVEVEALEIATLRTRVFSNKECRFAYRDSIFKNELKGQYIITSVTYRLQKNGPLSLGYGGLKQVQATTAAQVREAVIAIRRDKLPEVGQLGSAGSFFKNPVIPTDHYQQLAATYPDMPHYEVEGGVKIPAAWLIEQTGLKGHQLGGAQIYPKQPLVIVNANHATSQDIIALAQLVVDSVQTKFGIRISPEVNYI
ncbi:MAG: UDP-N-acetylmuramate dehydrogenase [Paludibacteraceae bacterium]|nr:UDP-N-acetylmuramate dehydrogenase [Paludibacteraceae bacterium]